ncbi:MAG TPA: single-stranded DNA-binding protein [Saprospiraceae bacterium]|nr:single-stranded DNA-binding protein [Saprospiraceae bacterium]
MITNHVTLIGRPTTDPEVVKFEESDKVCANFTLAVDRRKTKNEPNPEADFVRCTAWGHNAEFLGSYVKKGMQLGVEGRLRYRKWEDKEGKKCSALDVAIDDVKILERKKEFSAEYGADENVSNAPMVDAPEADDDNLPF